LTEEQHRANADGLDDVIFNAGGLTLYSYALRDTLMGIELPTVEAQLSNLQKR